MPTAVNLPTPHVCVCVCPTAHRKVRELLNKNMPVRSGEWTTPEVEMIKE